MTPVRVAAPTFEHHLDALGVGDLAPRLSWKIVGPAGWRQVGHEIEITRAGVPTSWVSSSEGSVLVSWPDRPLESREAATVRVRVWGADSRPSAWSLPGDIEAGLLVPTDWVATPVGPGWPELDAQMRPATLLRREFHLPAGPVRARLYTTAHGLVEMEINGSRVGTDELSPGWSSYRHRLRYGTYDVTTLLRAGPNAIGAWLGDGWFRGRLGFHGGNVNLYGNQTALLAQLEVLCDDGTTLILGSDTEWSCRQSPIRQAGLLEGERYDARLELDGWSLPGFAAKDWTSAAPRSLDLRTLVAPDGPPVRCTQEIRPVAAHARPGGRVILDFGQNIAGRLRICVEGASGHRVTLRHAEVLEDEELCTRPLRGASSIDEYILRGGGPETWEPRFTIHGFRYAEVTGWTGGPIEGNVVARVLHTAMQRTGWFECSDPLVSRFHENVVWSMRGNFVDLPTDCPQRDERLGWTGDIQVFGPTATFLYDCAGLLTSWLRDVAAEQYPDGTVPWFVPEIPGGEQWTPARPGAGWGDIAVLGPWTVHDSFGDRAVLEHQYASACAWADLVHSIAEPRGVWDTGYQLGDWLDPAAPPDDPADGMTDRYLVASAYYAHTTRRLAEIAGRLGRTDDEKRYRRRAAGAREGFRRHFLPMPGRLALESQAGYALAICFGLLDSEEIGIAGGRLADLVAVDGMHLSTGFLGTPLLLDALTQSGQRNTAFALLLQRGCPSWLYPVTMGATTVWERWDSLLPDGTVNPGEMTSFNHYALGAVADWLHREVGGIRSVEPGYRRVRFTAAPGPGITWARAAHETPYGRTSIEWRVEDDRLHVAVALPTGTSGVLELPGHELIELGSGNHECARDLVRLGTVA